VKKKGKEKENKELLMGKKRYKRIKKRVSREETGCNGEPRRSD